MKDRSYSLDFLKFICAMLIVFHHFQQILDVRFSDGGINYIGGKFYFGYIVELFFMLSGFFAAKSCDRILSGNLPFPEYIFKRLKRILPLMTVTAICYQAFIFLHHFLPVYPVEYIDKQFVSLPELLVSAFGMTDQGALTPSNVNAPTWFCSVLIVCYVLFYFCLYLAKRKDFNHIYIFLFVIFFSVNACRFYYDFPFITSSCCRGYASFFTGVILSYILSSKITAEYRGRISLFALLAVSLSTIIIIFFGYIPDAHIDNFTSTWVYFLFLLYPGVIIVMTYEPVQRFFRHNVFEFLGRISYDIFVWHCPLLVLTSIVLGVTGFNPDLSKRYYMYIFAGIAVIVGALSHIFIEKPLDKICGKIEQKLFG